MNFMSTSADITIQRDHWSTQDPFEWEIVVEVGLQSSDITNVEGIPFALRRTGLLDSPWGPWRAAKSDIEAVLGL